MVGKSSELKSISFKGDLVKGASMKVLVSAEQGWHDHVMRIIEVESGGHTPKHQHPWPHINYFISGKGELEIDGVIHLVESGDYAFVDELLLHQFRNTSTETLKFICIVPSKGHIY
jgi:quercetin dioxygenase-like cupin family protein